MTGSFTYLRPSDSDVSFGLYATVVGLYVSPPHTPYPEQNHPIGYLFDWESGRTIDEYQIIYIHKGGGILDYSGQTYTIKEGSLFLIKPNEHHRYKPHSESGWTEYYIGFSGNLSDRITSGLSGKPLIECGRNFEVVSLFEQLIVQIDNQRPSFQKICAGLILQLIGVIESHNTSTLFKDQKVVTLIENTRKIMVERVKEWVDFKELAIENGISYSYFRKSFKTFTGVSPHNYFLDLKVIESKKLLLNTSLNISEIAYGLGFNSIQYFSRLFKQRTGVSPLQFRNPNSILS